MLQRLSEITADKHNQGFLAFNQRGFWVILGYNRRPESARKSACKKGKNALMKRMKRTFALGLGLTFVWLTPAVALANTGDPVAAKDKISMCMGCHSIPNYKTAFPATYNVPKIGGQHAAYIVKALQAYKSGDRKHPSMRAIAATLSEQDMADVAAYYSNTAPAAPAAKK